MRTLGTNNLAQPTSTLTDFTDAVRVEVANATDVLTVLTGSVVSVEYSQEAEAIVDAATIVFRRRSGLDSLAPLMVASPPVALGRRVVISINPGSGAYTEVFRGKITDVDWPERDGDVTVQCLDQAGVAARTWIETARIYSTTGGVSLETVMQAVATDNLLAPVPTLYFPAVTAAVVQHVAGDAPYGPTEQSVLDAERALAESIGWTIRWRHFGAGTNEVHNSSFENGIDSQWAGYIQGAEGGTLVASTAAPFHGTRHARVTWTGANTGVKGVFGATGNVVFKPNHTYVISWYAKATTAMTLGMQTRWDTQPSITTLLNPNVGTSYQRYAFRLVWGATVDPHFFITIISNGGQAANDLDLDGIQIEDGEVLTAYATKVDELYGAPSSDWRWTVFAPARTKSVADRTFGTSEYWDVTTMRQSDADIRNVITVEYVGAGGVKGSVTVLDTASIAKYGRLYGKITEGSDSPVNDAAQATLLANAVGTDLAEPNALLEITCRYFWPGEIGVDLYTFTANGVHFSTDQTLAAMAFQHRIAVGERPTTRVLVRGKPSGGSLIWRGRIDAPPTSVYALCQARVVFSTTQATVTVTGTAPTGTPTVKLVALSGAGTLVSGAAIGTSAASGSVWVFARPAVDTADSQVAFQSDVPGGVSDLDLQVIPAIGRDTVPLVMRARVITPSAAAVIVVRVAVADPYPQGANSVSIGWLNAGAASVTPASPQTVTPDATLTEAAGTYVDFTITRQALNAASGRVTFTATAANRLTDSDAVEITALENVYTTCAATLVTVSPTTVVVQATGSAPVGTPTVQLVGVASGTATLNTGPAIGVASASGQQWTFNRGVFGAGDAQVEFRAVLAGSVSSADFVTIPEQGPVLTVQVSARGGSEPMLFIRAAGFASVKVASSVVAYPAAGTGTCNALDAEGTTLIVGAAPAWTTYGEIVFFTVTPYTGAACTGVPGEAVNVQARARFDPDQYDPTVGRRRRAGPFDDGQYSPRGSDAAGNTVAQTVEEFGGKAITRLYAKALAADADNLDSVGNGTTYARPLASRISAGKPLIDFAEAIHTNKNQDNIADTATRFAAAEAGANNTESRTASDVQVGAGKAVLEAGANKTEARTSADTAAVAGTAAATVQSGAARGQGGFSNAAGALVSGATESGTKAINRLLAKPLAADPDTLDSTADGTTYKKVTGVSGGLVQTASMADLSVTKAKTEARNRCKVFNSVSLAIANANGVVVGWDSEFFDSNSLHNATTNNTRITIPSGGNTGVWILAAQGTWAGTSTVGFRTVGIIKNGTNVVARVTGPAAPTSRTHQTVWAIEDAPAVGDYFEVVVTQNSGGNLDLLGASVTTEHSFFSGIHLW